MSKNSKSRDQTAARARRSGRAVTRKQVRRRQRMIFGGVAFALVIAVGVFMRYQQQSRLPPRLQGASDNHYTRGTAGAPVVVKEFSDYT